MVVSANQDRLVKAVIMVDQGVTPRLFSTVRCAVELSAVAVWTSSGAVAE